MLLAVDIGNSNIVLGIYQNTEWTHLWRIPTEIEQTAKHYNKEIKAHFKNANLDSKQLETLVLSSVVPPLTEIIRQILEEISTQSVILVGAETYDFLTLTIDNPKEIGTDLVANAVAAYTIYQQDCIVVDFGTALTFTTVDVKGSVQGVAIAPGLVTAMKALFGNTAQLPQVPLELPDSVVGKNTIHAIQSGILWGYIGMVRQIIQKTREELGEQYLAVATGGLSSILHPLKEDFHTINPYLTLDGLRIIAGKMQSK